MPEMLIEFPSSLTSSTSYAEEISIENVTMGVENSNQKKNRRKNGIQTENQRGLENEEEFLATAVRPQTYENGTLRNDTTNGIFYFTIVVSPAPTQIMDLESDCDAEGGPSAVLVSTTRSGSDYRYDFEFMDSEVST